MQAGAFGSEQNPLSYVNSHIWGNIPMKKIVMAATAFFCLLIGIAGSANAATYTLSNTNGGDGFVTLIPGGFDLFGADNDVPSGTSTTYLAIATASGPLTFNWTYTTNDCCGAHWDPAGYVINDVFTQLSADVQGDVVGEGNASGVVTLNVLAGQDFGFFVNSIDALEGRADIAVTGITAAVPEPSTWAMIILGFAGVGFVAYRRKRNGSALAAV